MRDGVCADFIRDKLGIAAATASRHLTLLTEAELLIATRKKGWTFYRRESGDCPVHEVSELAAVTEDPVGFAYSHVDVFSRVPFGGNSLPVFHDAADLTASQMLRITQEMRHFEAVFLTPTDEPNTVGARIFDLFEELPFAGHPIIGAAAVLHRRSEAGGAQHGGSNCPAGQSKSALR